MITMCIKKLNEKSRVYIIVYTYRRNTLQNPKRKHRETLRFVFCTHTCSSTGLERHNNNFNLSLVRFETILEQYDNNDIAVIKHILYPFSANRRTGTLRSPAPGRNSTLPSTNSKTWLITGTHHVYIYHIIFRSLFRLFAYIYCLICLYNIVHACAGSVVITTRKSYFRKPKTL